MGLHDDLAQIAVEQRALADRIDALLASAAASGLGHEHWEVFDASTDIPPVATDVDGTRQQRDWGAIVLWGSLAALNAREHRGASREEYVAIAKRAGYRDGRGWNAWTGWTDLSDGRWLDSAGEDHLRTFYEKQQRRIPADILDWLDRGGFAADS
ncbi:hypothetical protein [Microbacterium xylanilyticum]